MQFLTTAVPSSAISLLKKGRDRVLRNESLYRTYLRAKFGAGGPISLPAIRSENTVLKSRRDYVEATEQVKSLGLVPHLDDCKNWDQLIALTSIVYQTTKDGTILDAGAEIYSPLLPNLYLCGYRHLRGINLAFPDGVRRGPIEYEQGDITKTVFCGEMFDAIGCLSVIEHGVALDGYFKEMARILKPGGILVTSTDYYTSPIPTEGRTAYGAPVQIFSREEIVRALGLAAEYGLYPTSPIDLECKEKPVRWERMDCEYTFLVFTLRKTFGRLEPAT